MKISLSRIFCYFLVTFLVIITSLIKVHFLSFTKFTIELIMGFLFNNKKRIITPWLKNIYLRFFFTKQE